LIRGVVKEGFICGGSDLTVDGHQLIPETISRGVVENVEMVERGYERIEEKLKALGAQISQAKKS